MLFQRSALVIAFTITLQAGPTSFMERAAQGLCTK